MSYKKTFNYLLVRGRIGILTKLSRMVYLPYLIGVVKICLLRRIKFTLNLQMLGTVNLKMRFILNLSFLNMQLVHTFRIRHLQGTIGVLLHMLRAPYLLAK